MTARPDLARLADGFPDGCGTLGLLSGDEFLPEVTAFDRALLAATGPRVGLVLCADHRSAPKSGSLARDHFASLGAEVVDLDVIHGDDHPEVDLLYLAGGSPAELLDCLRGNEAWTGVMRSWTKGAGLCGASAGAMALCEHTLIPRPGDRVPTVWSRGLGPVRYAALAVHASSRPRAWLEAVAAAAPVALLALDDYTGVVLDPSTEPSVIGPGDAWFV